MDRNRGIVGAILAFCAWVGRPFYALLTAILPRLLFSVLIAAVFFKKLLSIFSFIRRKRHAVPSTRRVSWKTPIALLAATLVLFIVMVLEPWTLPSPLALRDHQPKLTTHILDRNGRELYKIYKDENRSLVSLNELPQYVIDATVAIEDKEFWTHNGFSMSGILRAFWNNLSALGTKHQAPGTYLQGGSTITQQLIKNTLLTPEKTFRRKVREVVLAFLIERQFSKKEILEMYLNEVSYGGTAYGIQEAAQQYFGKDAKNLSLSEATLLAGLPAAPTTYSPFGTNPDRATDRQQEVFRRMVEDRYITEDDALSASEDKLMIQDGLTNIKAPHFVMFVRDLLVREFGEDLVTHGGLSVTTTLDLSLQEFVQEIVTEEVKKLARLRVGNGAAMVTSPETGDILAMVGSIDFFDFAHDGQVNVTIRPRQPGSSIKPVMYAAALQKGFTPASVILDAPITFNIPGTDPYTPINYDRRFHGPVPLRVALASSYNVPAVKTLSTIGVETMIDQGEKMGIKTWADRSRFGLSLTLGGGEVTMVDMAEVYGTLANGGVRVPLNPIIKVEDSKGKVLYEYSERQREETLSWVVRCGSGMSSEDECATSPQLASKLKTQNSPPSRALPSSIASQLTSILSDPWARAPAFGTRSVLNIPGHEVAVKTGTTNSLRDNWTFGYTADRVVATWVGNNDNTPMSRIASGITGASPIWATIMKELLSSREEPHKFPTPDGLINVSICTITGQRSCEGCPSRDELFVPGTEPKEACRPEAIEELKKKREEEQQKRDQILEGSTTQR